MGQLWWSPCKVQTPSATSVVFLYSERGCFRYAPLLFCLAAEDETLWLPVLARLVSAVVRVSRILGD